MEARNQFLQMAKQDPRLKNVRPNGLDDVSEYKVDIDWEKQVLLVFQLIQFITQYLLHLEVIMLMICKNRKTKKVYIQADTPYRMLPEHINRLYVRNKDGKMTPFSSVASGNGLWITKA